MRSLQRLRIWGAGLLLLAAPPLPAGAETLVAGQRVRLHIPVPAGYSYEVNQDEFGVITVEMENPVWPITLRVFLAPDFPPEATTAEWQRNMVVRNSSQFLSESKQQDYRWETLHPEEGSGVYCVFSDAHARKPSELPPGHFLHVVTGAKVIRGVVMYFQIWCNDRTTPEYQEILNVLLNDFDRG